MSINNCPKCGSTLSPSDEYCPYCGSSVHEDIDRQNGYAQATPLTDTPCGTTERTGPEWESSNGSFVTRYINTVKSLVTAPSDFFANMRTDNGFGAPCVYILIGATIGVFFAAIYKALSSAFVGNDSITAIVFTMIMTWILAPFVIILGNFISAGIMHILVKIFGSTTEPYETTFRMYAYINGTVPLFNAIPFLGNIIGLILMTYYLIIGLTKVHGISTGKSCAIVLIPVALVTCCVIVAAFALGLSLVALTATGASTN